MTSPGDSGDTGLSVWALVAVGIAAIGLLAVVLLIAFPSTDDDPTPAAAAATTTTETNRSSAPATAPTSTAPPTTTTTTVAATTTAPPEADNPFVGWWRLADADGRSVDLRVDLEGTISWWDSASSLCENDGIDSPYAMAGFSTFKSFGTPALAVSGSGTCHRYGVGQQPEESPLVVFSYDAATDTIESADDGAVYARSPSVPGAPVDGANPFVGSWEGTDSDLTHVEMTIQADGSWQSTDTRSGGCERKGFTYATWSAEGSGVFDLGADPSFDITLTTYCHPVGGDRLVHSPQANFVLRYDTDRDKLVLDGAGVEYTRLP